MKSSKIMESRNNLIDKAISRLTISRNDWVKCIDFLNALSNHGYGDIAYEALLVSAIVFYARPFSHNEKGNNLKADAKVDLKVLEGLDETKMQLHHQVIELRNTAVAHMEWNSHPVAVTGDGVIQSFPFSIWQRFHQSDVNRFVELVNHVLNNAHHLTADSIHTKLLG